jgi:hypothetical protein
MVAVMAVARVPPKSLDSSLETSSTVANPTRTSINSSHGRDREEVVVMVTRAVGVLPGASSLAIILEVA